MKTKRTLIHIEQNHEDLAHFTAHHVANILDTAVKERGNATLVLSGGESPRRTYELLGSSPLRERLDWNRIHLFFGDERMVPPDHPDSNYGMARREMIDRLPIPEDRVHRIKGELKPEEAAEQYANVLRALYSDALPRFDCMLLGIGEDGHTASLFPGTDAVKEKKQSVVSLFVPRLNAWRVSLTFPVLNNARHIIVLAEGKKKSSVLAEAIGSRKPSPQLPVSLLRPQDGTLEWLLDSEAAGLLKERPGIGISNP